MKAKRELAHRDVEEAIVHYLEEGSAPAALGFIDTLERAYVHIGRHPASGSPRYGLKLNLPGLRCWPLARYPHTGLLRLARGQRAQRHSGLATLA